MSTKTNPNYDANGLFLNGKPDRRITIRDIQLDGNLFLAPMAGVTDMGFREICKAHGAALCYGELTSAQGIMYESKNTFKLLQTSPNERPVTLQLFGSDESILAEAAKRIEHLPFDILDINMGCPAPKIVNGLAGSALIEFPDKVNRILHSVSNAISKPVTCKIRKGINGKITAVEVAQAAEAGGAQAIGVHGRTREQQYEGVVDLDIIAAVKQSVNIPVIASGDVVDVASAVRTFKETKVDAIMIGRGTFGDPWIFQRLNHYFDTGIELPLPTAEEKINMCLHHAKKLCELKDERTGIREMRKQSGWYIKNLHGAAALRVEINKAETFAALEGLLMQLLERGVANSREV